MKTNIKIFQKGFNYSQDGPGNRLVYHLKGCNLFCPWCSNPEGINPTLGEYQTYSVADIVDEAVRSSPMFFDEGGVTFTGGEATLQFEPLKAALIGLKEKGISTAIETNGTSKKLPTLFPFLDHLIIDLKHPNGEKHKTVTGMDNQTVVKNIIAAMNFNTDTLVRVPLIGGFNDDDETLNAFTEFFASLKGKNMKFEILTYHEYGKDKWQKCGLEYKLENGFVPVDTKIKFENMLKSEGLTVVRT